jgi:hypothetical protein
MLQKYELFFSLRHKKTVTNVTVKFNNSNSNTESLQGFPLYKINFLLQEQTIKYIKKPFPLG